MTTHHDEEHTSLTAAVAALGDDAGRAPSIDEIAAQRRFETRAKAVDAVKTGLVGGKEEERYRVADGMVRTLERAGFSIVQRRPE